MMMGKKILSIQLSEFFGLLLLMLSINASAVFAQNPQDIFVDLGENEQKFTNLGDKDGYSHKLMKMIHLEEGKKPLEKALQDIADQAELELSYSEQLIPLDKKVNVRPSTVTVKQALWNVLRGTSLRFGVSASGQLFFFERLKEKPTNQLETVSGTVTEAASGEALPGVNVVIKGTTTGASTDTDGSYSMNVKSLQDTLLFSFIGYQTMEVPINGRTVIDVQLTSQAIMGEEMVVVAYGTQRKNDITGSISRVSSEKIQQVQEQPITNFIEGLSGQVAGVHVQETGHAPGEGGIMVRIRGTGSISAGNSPLYVVDGFPLEDEGDVNMINPNNIESIEVLKDASATAIYGSRGNNGVVLITTRKGHSGDTKIEISAYTGIQQVERRPEMLNTQEYVEWFKDAHNNAWIQAGGEADDPNSERTETYYMIPEEFNDPSTLPNTNWGDEIFRTVPIQNYQAQISGGTETSRYLVSGSYTDQQGIVIGTDHKKMNIRTNVSGTVADRLEMGLNMTASYSKSNQVENGKYGPVELSLVVPPIYPSWDADEDWYGSPLTTSLWDGDDPSPVESALEIDDVTKNYRTLWQGYVDWELTQHLNFKTSLGGFFSQNRNSFYQPSFVNVDSNPAPNPVEAESSTSSSANWLWENTLSYNQQFNKHSIDAVAGVTYQAQRSEFNGLEATNFPNDQVHTLNAGQVTDGYSSVSEFSLMSYLARVNYTYDSRYLLTTTIRADGSSRFGDNNKWGFFPSISVGWRLSEEGFIQDIESISELKIRSSFGYTGNNAIPNYGSIGTLSTVNSVFGSGSGSVITGVSPQTISNPNLSWEKARQYDIGLEVGLFEDRIFFEADYYNTITNDLLLFVPIPTITGYNSQLQNIGEVENKGLEFDLNTRNIQGNFNWQTNLNISFNKNTVLSTGPNNQPIFASSPNVPNGFVTMVGEPIANYYGYDFIGVFQTQEDLENYPHLSTDGLGDPIIRDVNGDGVINTGDRTIIGNNQPDFTFGINNNFEYNNFDLSVQMTGSYGGEVFTTSSRFTKWYHGDRNARKNAVNRYRSPEEPGDGHYFIANRLYEGLQKEPSSYWVQDGSYLRVRNITLGYNFSQISNLPFQSGRIYLSVRNAYTFTNYFGFDPEVSTAGTGLTRGGDYTGYPPARVFTLGFNISI
ncbi:TonB-dependent receptor [Aliifodinibius sp. S!AR15-10]|uniref:SusC/RagA family TonB-linked outer membrane protein n=1 Tax=Aliifodinibius sp. S!AR15-10 TaxID=2950437 RepID=UPI0028678371|nr:TonB-dependent receptor [Aliifodinibius sp. S!AR15-10]MDR8389911.1 TonB-dependent receptor [Aliifodinibius sp. S!AR15-10]